MDPLTILQQKDAQHACWRTEKPYRFSLNKTSQNRDQQAALVLILLWHATCLVGTIAADRYDPQTLSARIHQLASIHDKPRIRKGDNKNTPCSRSVHEIEKKKGVGILPSLIELEAESLVL